MPDGKKEGRNKADDKALMAAKRENKEWELANGITKYVRSAMAGDVLMCVECKATQMGPAKCECSGGRTKPGADYDATLDLAAAAKARMSAIAAAARNAQSAAQSTVAKEKAKRKEGGLSLAELADQGLLIGDNDGISITEFATFVAAKLGMGLEANCVASVADGTQAAEQCVKVGWVLRSIGGVDVATDKTAIMKAAGAALKANPNGVKFGFQTPIDPKAHSYCKGCDKFVEVGEFEGASAGLDAGPGKQICVSCEEFAAEYGGAEDFD